MPLGPVFNAELLDHRPAGPLLRRPVPLRADHPLPGLPVVPGEHLAARQRPGRAAASSEMADFGQQIFIAFAIVQAVVVLLLTPALVGGAIADERQRKTLHYLLTSELSSAEIILGKLAARLLQVGVLVALGLPVVSLIGLFGGVDFQVLLLTYAATLTTIYFLATASILVSVVSRRPREAISLLYVLEMVWLIVPTILMTLDAELGRALADDRPSGSTRRCNTSRMTSPVYLMTPMALDRPRRAGERRPSGGWACRSLYGTPSSIAGVVRLRPSSRNEGGLGAWLGGRPDRPASGAGSPGPSAATTPCSGRRCTSPGPAG